jgi:hypothetical protein
MIHSLLRRETRERKLFVSPVAIVFEINHCVTMITANESPCDAVQLLHRRLRQEMLYTSKATDALDR